MATPKNPSARFVILSHQSPTGEHWDVMLEAGSALATWSIPPQYPAGDSFTCSAIRLPDHRKDYLDYEGEISEGRGTVSRISAGTYEPQSPEQFLLHSPHFSGILTMKEEIMVFESFPHDIPPLV
jgi:hypothetical protein